MLLINAQRYTHVVYKVRMQVSNIKHFIHSEVKWPDTAVIFISLLSNTYVKGVSMETEELNMIIKPLLGINFSLILFSATSES